MPLRKAKGQNNYCPLWVVRALGRQLWSFPSSQLMVITQVVGSPRPGGGQELLSPPHTDAAAYQMLVPSAWGGAKSSKNIPGGWRKASQARLFYPHPHQCLNPGGCFWGCLPPPTPDLPVFLAVLKTGLEAPAARRPSAAVWLSAPRRFTALPVPPCLSSPAGFVSLLPIYFFIFTWLP